MSPYEIKQHIQLLGRLQAPEPSCQACPSVGPVRIRVAVAMFDAGPRARRLPTLSYQLTQDVRDFGVSRHCCPVHGLGNEGGVAASECRVEEFEPPLR